MPSATFTNAPRFLAKGDLDWDTMNCKVLLVTSQLSEANIDAFDYRADITNEVANGNGYATGGIAQAYTLDALNTTTNAQTITYTNITNGWTAATFSAAGAIIYKDTGNAATDILLHYIEFASALTPSNGSASITYNNSFSIARA